MRKINYKIEKSTALIHYVFDFIFDVIGVIGESVNSDVERFDVFYGIHSAPETCNITIVRNDSDIIWEDLVNSNVTPESVGSLIPFDLIHAIGVFLTDQVNNIAPVGAYDEHERLRYDQSFQVRQKVARIPLVNSYVNFLKSLFEKKLSIRPLALWPEGKMYAIGLSHDVDMPDKYAIFGAPYFSQNLNLKTNILNSLKRVKDVVVRKFDRDPDNFWLFNEIIKSEDNFGFKSTFFFASINRFGDWGTGWDVLYDLRAPKFQEVFAEIRAYDFEIGLHASYGAYQAGKRFVIEKQNLSALSGSEVKGLRHHFWHMGRDVENTQEMHAQAGFEYDSSIAFNEHLGFRRNLALPYHPWSTVNSHAITTIQLPVFCMDGHLFYRPTKFEDTLIHFKSYIDTIKQIGGLGVIDWHVRTSYPKSPKFINWGKTYLKILEYLSADREVWVTNLSEINSWLKKRRQLLCTSE